jgi:hypothetical protein
MVAAGHGGHGGYGGRQALAMVAIGPPNKGPRAPTLSASRYRLEPPGREPPGRWPLAAGRWPLAAGRWPLAPYRLQFA